MSGDLIASVARIEARVEERDWPWARANAEAVAANWERRLARTPGVFNGRVLMVVEHALDGDAFRAVLAPVDYRDFLAWIDLGFPDPTVANGFAMGALRSACGAYVLGVMGRRTANAGKVYFAAGTPDLSDVRPDGSVDLLGSVTRELLEETGLGEPDLRVGEGWTVVRSGALLAFLRPVACPLPAEAVRERILAHIARDPQPELDGVRLARGPADIDEAAMPAYLQAYLRWSFARG